MGIEPTQQLFAVAPDLKSGSPTSELSTSAERINSKTVSCQMVWGVRMTARSQSLTGVQAKCWITMFRIRRIGSAAPHNNWSPQVNAAT